MNALLFFVFFSDALRRKEIAAKISDRGSIHWHFLLKKKIIIFGQNLSSDPPKKEMNALLFFSNALPVRKLLQKFQTERVFTDTSSWNKK